MAENEDKILKAVSILEQDVKKIKNMGNRGGSIPLQVSANGAVANVRYADINFIGDGHALVNPAAAVFVLMPVGLSQVHAGS